MDLSLYQYAHSASRFFPGIIVSFLSILFGIWLIIEKIRFGQIIPGFTTFGF